MAAKNKFQIVDEYIDSFPKDIQANLKKLRLTLRKSIPGAEETISYQIPVFKKDGKNIIFFAAWKNHIALYPIHTGVESLKKELTKYEGSKSSVHFPLDKPLPFSLIRKIATLKAKEYITPVKEKGNPVNKEIQVYNNSQTDADKKICTVLAKEISRHLPKAENKIWHRHPVWFLDGNPIVGYHKLKDSVRLLFWSGQSFDEKGLLPEGSFKAAEARYISVDQINKKDLKRWLTKSKKIQWDYKNIVKHKGVLKKL